MIAHAYTAVTLRECCIQRHCDSGFKNRSVCTCLDVRNGPRKVQTPAFALASATAQIPRHPQLVLMCSLPLASWNGALGPLYAFPHLVHRCLVCWSWPAVPFWYSRHTQMPSCCPAPWQGAWHRLPTHCQHSLSTTQERFPRLSQGVRQQG